jgi:hypothetical protein
MCEQGPIANTDQSQTNFLLILHILLLNRLRANAFVNNSSACPRGCYPPEWSLEMRYQILDVQTFVPRGVQTFVPALQRSFRALLSLEVRRVGSVRV